MSESAAALPGLLLLNGNKPEPAQHSSTTLPGLLRAHIKQEPVADGYVPLLVDGDGKDDWQDVRRDPDVTQFAESDEVIFLGAIEDDGVEVKEEPADEFSEPSLHLAEFGAGQQATLAMHPATTTKPACATHYQPETLIPSRSPTPVLASAEIEEDDSLFVPGGHAFEPLSGFRTAFDHARRMLQADGTPANSTCFSQHAREPLRHILWCGHEFTTDRAQACNVSCQDFVKAEHRPSRYGKFICKHLDCLKNKKRHDAVFNFRYKGGDRKVPINTAAVQDTRFTNRFARELGIDAKDALFKMRNKGTKRRTRRATPKLSQVPRSDIPRSGFYARGGIRNQEAGSYSMPDHIYAQMVEDEEGSIIPVLAAERNPKYDKLDGVFDAEDLEEQDAEDEQNPAIDHEMADLYCICQSPADGNMLPCAKCGHSYHPKCFDKDLYAAEEYDGLDGWHAYVDDTSHFLTNEIDFLCRSCHPKAKRALVDQMFSGSGLDMDARNDAADFLVYHAQANVKLRVALRGAGDDAMAIQAANDEYAVEAARDEELLAQMLEKDEKATVGCTKTRFGTRQLGKYKALDLSKPVASSARVAKTIKRKLRGTK
ncbi:hypothetical protein LTR62_007965 [Meristemomyces frigidus]|uniref:Zinc finger PHD-type domain-containing protein n=1 Tax=Meristemomyces frigidus TaxID=1508187 RepID=A0AAN7TM39_9PEZI|nr:hypothetical protein LTR62_007965 [Meristemomyces frigidus]